MSDVTLLPISTNVLDSASFLDELDFSILVVTTNDQGRFGGLEADLSEQMQDTLLSYKEHNNFIEVEDEQRQKHRIYVLPNSDTRLDYSYVIAVVDNGLYSVESIMEVVISKVVMLSKELFESNPVLVFPIPRTGVYKRLSAEDMINVACCIYASPLVMNDDVTLMLACRDPELHTALNQALESQKK